MKTKSFNVIAAMIIAAAFAFSSCNKDEVQPSKPDSGNGDSPWGFPGPSDGPDGKYPHKLAPDSNTVNLYGSANSYADTE